MLSDGQNIFLAKYACLCSCERSDNHYRTYVALALYSTVFTICTTCYNIKRIAFCSDGVLVFCITFSSDVFDLYSGAAGFDLGGKSKYLYLET
jgi:hypothetical protein